ncbi:MAG: hypothetical protein KA354_09820 [Phycisphaerae bacterium]|nr:hypothetical protein [Phycisphaerae bacterium]
MSRSRLSRRAALGVASLAALACACSLLEIPSNVLINNMTVNIARDGGSAELMFAGIAGEEIIITLTGRIDGMVPYAQLIAPNGGSSTVPDASTAENGINSVQITLAQTGGYTLIIYDDAQVGGAVTVRVELVR